MKFNNFLKIFFGGEEEGRRGEGRREGGRKGKEEIQAMSETLPTWV